MSAVLQDQSRRHFLKTTVVVSGGLMGAGLIVGCASTGMAGSPKSLPPSAFAPGAMPNAWVKVSPDNQVTIINARVEMGQGTFTSMPMLVAEELDVPINSIRVEMAPAKEPYINTMLGGQITGGSTSVREAYDPLRVAGAQARALLVMAAAEKWKVDAATLRTENAYVVGPAGQRASYGELAEAASKLTPPKSPQLKAASAFKIIGKPVNRLDTPSKVDGTAIYGIDARPPGVKFATLAQSPVFGGRVKRVDDSAARTIKGVRQIVRLDDAVAVVADHTGAARKGLAALVVEWDDGPNAGLDTGAIAADLAKATLRSGPVAQGNGDIDRAMATAVTKVEAIYEVPFLAHAALEPMNCTVHVRNDSCEIWVGNQAIARCQAAAAKVTGLPPEKVVLHNHLIGGGFGRRLESDGVARAVQIAMHVDGPVKVVWSREEDIRHDMYRPYFYDRISAGLDDKGMPVAWNHRFAGSSIIARYLPPAFKDGLDPDTTEGAIDLVYAIPNFRVEYLRAEPPGIPTAFWRSVGPSHNVFVTESFIDELAAAARQDPVAYRRALLGNAPRARTVLDLAADKADWGKPLPARMGRGVSVQFVFGTYLAQVAEVEVSKDGAVRVRRVVCAVDCGTVVNPDTVEAQIQSAIVFGITAALHGQITLKNGRVEQSNFHDYPMLRINETPAIDVHIVSSTEAPGGMGEAGTSAIVPAVANAIYAATGKRLRKPPVATAALQAAYATQTN